MPDLIKASEEAGFVFLGYGFNGHNRIAIMANLDLGIWATGVGVNKDVARLRAAEKAYGRFWSSRLEAQRLMNGQAKAPQ